ncbi:bifunctional diaminohydroxyphosphoribosylaminopyrimidine deaminase/5-amino-6-(5-phosphoribosylamino)uracil reductase RibD, partial [candidate division WOR-3 bacterium]|nr:bifunctional diaminohydroxyphosphoribosylaminopyrimidine deaminase/5-amino-6-(5-phosphoribosylamino)uracil reductase RibD [candidate division WOR-3 bacterium]
MDSRFMAEALALAARGLGMTSPNPMVGAVLVKGGRVVGRGFHRRFGGPHAEVVAIRDAGRSARGSTLYVTMEPCCYCGKTPACTDAVEQAGIKAVYAATLDPNRRVNGTGVKCLRRAGVKVRVGMMAAAARRLNEAYFIFTEQHRPFVVLKVAVSLDGMMATGTGESQWITGEKARRFGQVLRKTADAVVVGVNTVLTDDPRLTCRVAKGKKLLRVVLDSDLRLGLDCRLFEEAGPVLVFTGSTHVARRARLERAGAEVIRVRLQGRGRINWLDTLEELYRRQAMTVLVEGGATVASSALESGVVDKAYVFHAPKV